MMMERIESSIRRCPSLASFFRLVLFIFLRLSLRLAIPSPSVSPLILA